MRKQIFKIVTLGLSLLLLTGCSTPTYIRNITVTTMDSANDGTGNIFSYDSDDLAEKTPSDMEAENPLNAPDKDYFVNKFVYTSLGEDVSHGNIALSRCGIMARCLPSFEQIPATEKSEPLGLAG